MPVAPDARQATVPKLFVALPLAAMGVLIGLSSVPGVVTEQDPALYALFAWVPPTLQNLAHIPAFLVLALLWRHALGAWLAPRAAALTTLAICGGFAVLDEWYQTFIPGRYGTAQDVLLDLVGAALGVALYGMVRRLLKV